MSAPWVLIVEDSIDIRQTMGDIVEMAGYGVRLAAHGADALAQLRAAPGKPCVILLDLMMPVMDGYQFCEEQRRDPALADIPIVLITADGRAKERAAALGVAGFLMKPIDLDDLMAAVSRYG